MLKKISDSEKIRINYLNKQSNHSKICIPIHTTTTFKTADFRHSFHEIRIHSSINAQYIHGDFEVADTSELFPIVLNIAFHAVAGELENL